MREFEVGDWISPVDPFANSQRERRNPENQGTGISKLATTLE